jgi:hypothetical protein
MMRVMIFGAVLLSGLAGAQEVAYLDLTGVTPRVELRHPPAPPPKCDSNQVCTGTGFGSGIGGVGVADGGEAAGEKRALRTSLTFLDRSEYTNGDHAEIEVMITNAGDVPIEIPCTPHLADLQPADETSKFQAFNLLVGLFLHWGDGYSTSLGWISLYGVPDQRESMLTLSPGEWVRVRGPIDIKLDRGDYFALPLPGAGQTATAEFELRQVEYTPLAGGVGLSNITNMYPRHIHGNAMPIAILLSSDARPSWTREILKPLSL